MEKYRIKKVFYDFHDSGLLETYVDYVVQVRGFLFWHDVKSFSANSFDNDAVERAEWDAVELYKMLIEDGRP